MLPFQIAFDLLDAPERLPIDVFEELDEGFGLVLVCGLFLFILFYDFIQIQVLVNQLKLILAHTLELSEFISHFLLEMIKVLLIFSDAIFHFCSSMLLFFEVIEQVAEPLLDFENLFVKRRVSFFVFQAVFVDLLLH